MSDSAADTPLPRHDPLAALRQPNFLRYTVSRVFATMGMMLLQAVMAWHVYDITGSALNLGLLGLIRFLPALGLALVGGAVADTYNRRNIIVIAQTVPLATSIFLAVATLGGWVEIEMIFGVVLLLGLSSAFEGPARSALLPAIVTRETFANAVTVSSALQTVGMVSGPMIAGGVIAAFGVGTAYCTYTALVTLSLIPMFLLRYTQTATGQRVNIQSIKEGIHFVRQRPVLLGAMTLDMFAVIFGGAQALLPVYAKDILDTGALGYGLLYSSLDLGACLTSVVLLWRPPIQNAGRVLIFVVILYGIFTFAFGISRIFALSVVFYGLIGAADQISVVLRNTIIQLSTPDELRGRVSAVSQVFIGASNQLGAVESGFLAAITSATFAVASGGLAAIGVSSWIGWRNKELFNYVVPREEVALERDREPAGAAAGG